MSVDDVEDSVPAMSVDSEIKELMGLFDVPAFAPRPGPGVLAQANPCPLPAGARGVLGDGPAAAPPVVARGDRAGRLERGLRRANRLTLAACAIRAASLGRAGCPRAAKADRGTRPGRQRSAFQCEVAAVPGIAQPRADQPGDRSVQ